MRDHNEALHRDCPICGTPFVAQNPRKHFCSDKCRVANHALKKEQERYHQEETVAEQAQVIQQLSEAPITRTQRVQEINPVWRLRHQVHQTELSRYNGLQTEISRIQTEKRQQTATRQGAYVGAGLGFSLAVIMIAVQYTARPRRQGVATFVVVSLVGLFWAVWLGQYVHLRYFHSLDETVQARITELNQQEQLVEKQLAQSAARLAELQQAMDNLPQFQREVVTIVNEVRDTTLV